MVFPSWSVKEYLFGPTQAPPVPPTVQIPNANANDEVNMVAEHSVAMISAVVKTLETKDRPTAIDVCNVLLNGHYGDMLPINPRVQATNLLKRSIETNGTKDELAEFNRKQQQIQHDYELARGMNSSQNSEPDNVSEGERKLPAVPSLVTTKTAGTPATGVVAPPPAPQGINGQGAGQDGQAATLPAQAGIVAPITPPAAAQMPAAAGQVQPTAAVGQVQPPTPPQMTGTRQIHPPAQGHIVQRRWPRTRSPSPDWLRKHRVPHFDSVQSPMHSLMI